MPQTERLCHGDFEPENLILGEDGEIWILDWSRASQGNPEADAAKTWLRFMINGDPAVEGTKAQANVDEDLARRIEETIRQNIMLVEVPQYSPVLDPENDRIFIRSDVIEMWLSGKTWMERKPIQAIRNYSKIGLLDRVSPKIMKYPHHGENRRHGIMWNYEQEKEVRIIGMNGTNKAKEVVEKT